MAFLSFTVSIVAMAVVANGAALPQIPDAQASAPSCLDKAQGTTFTWSPANSESISNNFEVLCGNDYYGGDLRSLNADTFQDCLEACSTDLECVAVAYGGTSCYLKNDLRPAMASSGVWSAKRANVKKGLTCNSDDSSDGKTYTSSKGDFKIACGKDYWGNDLSAVSTKTFEACIETCATTDKCVDVSYVNEACYLKYTVGTAMDAASVWTATLVNAKPFAAGLSCDGNKDDKKTYAAKNGGTYTVECGIDYYGGDLSALDASTFEACMDSCDSTTGCIDVSYTSGRCYMKNQLNSASTSSWVWSGRKVIETPLDLTQTTSVPYANVQVTTETDLVTMVQTGNGRAIGSTSILLPVKANTLYEVSFEYFQQATQGQSYYIEVSDGQGIISSLWWSQNAVGSPVNIDPYYSVPQINSCYKQKSMPQITPASGTWQTGSFVLYPRTNQAWFRRDMGGLGTMQWRNVYVREKTNDYCGLPA